MLWRLMRLKMPIKYKDFRPYVGSNFKYTPPKAVTSNVAKFLEVVDSKDGINLTLDIKNIGIVAVQATPDILKQIKRYRV